MSPTPSLLPRRQETLTVVAPSGVWDEVKRRIDEVEGTSLAQVLRRFVLAGLTDFRTRWLHESASKMLEAFEQEGRVWAHGSPSLQMRVRFESHAVARLKASAEECRMPWDEFVRRCLVHGLALDTASVSA